MENLLRELKDNNIVISLKEKDLKIKFNGPQLPASILEKLKNNKVQLIEYLSRLNTEDPGQHILPANERAYYPLSSSQRRLWILSQFEDGNIAYNIPGTFVFEGALQTSALDYAFKALVARHEILRTVFREDETGEVRQYILAANAADCNIFYQDLQHETDQDTQLRHLVQQEFIKPFDLAAGPLIRISVYQVTPNKWTFVYVLHHIITDGWSIDLLNKELLILYTAFSKKEDNLLQPLRIQFKDYAVWEQELLKARSLNGHRDYWLQQFEGEIPVLDLYGDHPRPAVKTFNGSSISTNINEKISTVLKLLAREQGGTLFMSLLASVYTLLYKYTGQEDIVIGSPIAGRGHIELENQIGFYVNTLALRTRFNATDNYQRLFQQVKEVTMAAYSHQVYPFDELVSELDFQRDPARSPLFDVMVVLANTKISNNNSTEEYPEEIKISGDRRWERVISKFDLTFNFAEVSEGRIHLSLEYNSDIYDRSTIERMLLHFKQLLGEITTAPANPLSELGMLTAEELPLLVSRFNNTAVALPANKTVLDLFNEQVNHTPGNIALSFQQQTLTYQALDELSDQLAAHLKAVHTLQNGDLIGLRFDRGEKMVVAMLGILKAGCAYIPLDTEYPVERIDYIVANSGCKLLLDESIFNELNTPAEKYHHKPDPKAPAYVIYTSGSTGTPKGVKVSHLSLLNYITFQRSNFNISNEENILQFSSISFDASVEQIFLALTSGACLTIADKETRTDPALLAALIEEQGITHVHMFPGMLKLLPVKKYSRLRRVVSGGDRCPKELAQQWSQYCDFYNKYGPTETTISSIELHYNPDKTYNEILPIGYPVANTSIYILNTAGTLQLMPIGIPGEICIGGTGVAAGYINDPSLSAQKFIADPFKPGHSIYLTGDKGRWLPDGTIEFLGRIDHQVKVNGHRIEPGEIERVLEKHPDIKAAVVIPIQNKGEISGLAAYFLADKQLKSEEVRAFIASGLPAYMIPHYFMQLEAFPLTPGGKIDRKRFPEPAGMEDGLQYISPKNEAQQVLTGVLQEVLRKERIGLQDNFYLLGGDSIKAIQVVSRMKQRGYSLKVNDLLRYPDLKDLSERITASKNVISQSAVSGTVQLTPVQNWFFQQHHGNEHYNQSVLLWKKGGVSVAALERIIAELLRHHDMLRAVYNNQAQEIKPVSEINSHVFVTDLRGIANWEEQLDQNTLQAGFPLDKGPLFRAGVFHKEEGDFVLLVCHHLVVDGVSWRIILDDLRLLYNQYEEGIAFKLPSKTDSFQKWAALQHERALNERLMMQDMQYWSNLSAAAVTPLSPGGINKAKDIQSVSFSLSADITTALQGPIHEAYNTNINDVLLSALGLALQDVFRLSRFFVLLEGHGREDIFPDTDITRTVGWFTTMFPILLDLKETAQIENLVHTKDMLRRIPNKGIGYGMLRYADPAGIKYAIQPDIVFNYLGDFDQSTGVSENKDQFEMSAYRHGADISPDIIYDWRISVTSMIVQGKLHTDIRYGSTLFTKDSIDQLKSSYENRLRDLIEALSHTPEKHITPGDFSYPELSTTELASLQEQGMVQDVYQLSPLQEGIYYHWLSAPESTTYVEQLSYRIHGSLDIQLLEAAFYSIVERHDVLRTNFTHEYGGKLLQVVRKEMKTGFTYNEGIDAAVKDAGRTQGFDLQTSALMRLTVYKLDTDQYEFVWTHHHILMDGWCAGLLIKEFYTIYREGISSLPAPRPYRDYIHWLQQHDKWQSLDFWSNYLNGVTDTVMVPFRNAGNTAYNVRQQRISLDESTTDLIRKICWNNGVTENTFMQSVWGVLLAKYNGVTDVVMGTVVSGRPGELDGVEEMIGLFVNTIPVRISFEPGTGFTSLLKQSHAAAIEAVPHHYVSLSEIQNRSLQGRSLVNHLIVFENYPIQEMLEEELESGESTGEHLRIMSMDSQEQTNYPFNVIIAPAAQQLDLIFNYNGNEYDDSAVSLIGTHLKELIRAFVANPEQDVTTASFLDSNSKDQILNSFNATETDYPRDATITALFEWQVTQTPEKTALVFGENRFTYNALNKLSNRLSDYLRSEHAIANNDLVGIRLERSEWVIISVLAILKAGAAYVPVDPEYPAERVADMLSDCGTRVVIDEAFIQGFLQTANQEENIPVAISANDLAYIMYTSGSTGRPKGVMVEHRAVVRLVKNTEFVALSGHEVVLSTGALSFDATTFEYWSALLNGGCLVLCPQHVLLEPAALSQLMQTEKVDTIWFTAGWLHQLVDGDLSLFAGLRTLLAGGDRLSPVHIAKLRSHYPDLKIINGYGPTENTTFSLTYDIAEVSGNIPVGRPISNSYAYILDDRQQLLPIGVAGEICVAGDGLSRGYLHRPELTAEKFVANPFRPGERMYLTGDLGRWLPEGNIEFLGRKDEQVKIRGYRIELGEIEAVLQTHESISSAVVIAREQATGEKELVAYITGPEALTIAAIRQYLGERLPAYMLPAHFVQLDELPLTPNGKVDRKRLPSPEGQDMDSGVQYIAPRNEKEQALVAVFEQVLHKQPIGIQDNFFVLGGDSIKSIQIASRLKQRGYRVSIQDILRYPEIINLSLHVHVASRVADQGIVTGLVPLGPVQSSFLAEGTAAYKHHFNQSVLLKGNPRIDEAGLAKALSALVLHHDALRMVYRNTPDGWEQENLGADQGYHLEVHTTNDPLPYYELLQSGFDLANGPLLRAGLFHGEDADRLLLVIHHLVVDGVSWRILLEDLSSLYGQHILGVPFSLPQKTDSFQYWQQQLRAYNVAHELPYWSELESHTLPVFPVDTPDGTNLVRDAVAASFVLEEELTTALRHHCYKAYRTEINDILLAGLALSLEEVFGLSQVGIRMEGHGREDIGMDVDVSRTVGWFTTLYPVVLEMGYTDRIAQLVGVKERLHRIPQKGLGYGLLRHLSGLDYRMQPALSFNYLGDFGSSVVADDKEEYFTYTGEARGHEFSPLLERDVLLAVSGLMAGGRLQLSFTYSRQQYEASTINNLLSAYRRHLEALITQLSQETKEHLSPVDLTYKELQVSELAQLTEKIEIEDLYPLSPLQEGLYYHWSSYTDAAAYFVQMSYRIRGELNIRLLEQAYQLLVDRHAILRTFFTENLGDTLLQVVQKNVKGDFHYQLINGTPEEMVTAYRATDRSRGFNLHTGSQMRLAILDLGEDTYEFIWSFHHILMDGWCGSILIKEFFELYYGLLQGQLPELKPVHPYSAYFEWLAKQNKVATLAYWKKYLSGYESLSTLPSKNIAADTVFQSQKQSLFVAGDIRTGLRDLCADLGITESSFVQGIWGTLLGKYNNTDDVIFGAVVAGRPGDVAGIEDMIGLFINTVPVRIRFNDSSTVKTLLQDVQKGSIESTSHHYVQLAEVQGESELGRNLFDHILIYENYPVQDMLGSGSASEEQPRLSLISANVVEQTNYDLTIVVLPGESLEIRFIYNANRYDEDLISRISKHFYTLITQAVQNPGKAVRDLAMLDHDEQYQLIHGFNNTATAYEADGSILALFDRQVNNHPDAAALLFNNNTMSYADLDAHANRFANFLHKNYALQQGELAAILLERSEWMIITILGILKTGAAYLPIDPSYPKKRIDYMLEDSACKLLIDHHVLAHFQNTAAEYNNVVEAAASKPTDLAYVIYTSGSTAAPKGCAITHGSLYNYIQWATSWYFTALPCFGLFTSLSFDLTITSIFCPLTTGGRLEVFGPNEELAAILQYSFSPDSGINSIKLTPSHISILEHLDLSSSTMEVAIVGGEEVTPKHVSILKKINPHIRVYNEYGPTEATVGCIVKELEENTPVLIGQPIANMYIYILDKHNDLSPIGVPGELYIGGAQLAAGYLNNPALTDKKFLPDPFRNNARIYKTGDLAEWLPDGDIRFLGRNDDQVKIRGYRISLGEIETALLAYPGISTAAVIASGADNADRKLVAYFVSTNNETADGIREFMMAGFPAYMIPSHFVQMEEIPLTVNGKIDRRRLPAPGESSTEAYVAPRNEKEQQLAAVFEEVLKKRPVSIQDNFFILGGDSIKSIQLVSRLRKRGYQLSIKDVMRYPILSDLALHIRTVTRTIDQHTVEGLVDLGPIQIAFLESNAPEKHHFNQSVLLKSSTPIHETALRQALSALVMHHDALRMVYRQTPEGWQQENLGIAQGYHLEVLDTNEPLPYYEQLQSGIDLSNGPLLRAGLFHDRLLLVIHHLVVDGVSWRILLEDLSALYDQFTQGLPFSLPQKTDSFQYWQQQLRKYNTTNEEAYWAEKAALPLPAFPLDHQDGSNFIKDTVSSSFVLDEQLTADLQHHCYKAYRTEINDILLSSLALAIEDTFRIPRVAIQLEGHGREDIGIDVDVSRTVGWFTTLYPVIIDMGYKNQIEQLVSVKEQLHRIPNKGIGYGVLRYLKGHAYNIAPAVNFNYLGDFGSNVSNADSNNFTYANEAHGRDFSPLMERDVQLGVSGMIAAGRLQLTFTYSDQQYKAATIASLLSAYRRHLETLIRELSQESTEHLTPVDLTYKGLQIAELAELSTRYTIEDLYPLSPLQEGLYYHWATNPEAAAYFEQLSYRIRGQLNVQLLEQSYQLLVARHAILRTLFTELLLQVVQKNVSGIFNYETINENDVIAYRDKDRSLGFDLHNGSQMRLTVLGLGDDTYEFIWSFHHILMDGWCGSILIKEFFQYYHALSQGINPDLKPVYPYSTYFNWLARKDKAATLAYWHTYLQGYDTIASLPRTASATGRPYEGQKRSLYLEGPVRKGISQLCAQIGITENTFIQVMWGILLSRYNDTDDVVFGTVVSGRPPEVEGIEEMIGLFINTIPVRVNLKDNASIKETLQSVQQSSIESTSHHYVQLAEVQSQSEPGRNLFDHILVFENYPVQEVVEKSVEDNQQFSLLSFNNFEQTNYDLSIVIIPGDVMDIQFSYNTNCYEPAQIERLTHHLFNLIAQAVENPAGTISQLSYISKDEQHQLIEAANNALVDYPRHQTIIGLFEEQVAMFPANIAVVYEDRQLSYAALNEVANQLAHYLKQNYEVHPDTLIGICLERSEWMVISILAILKAGAAYVPVDPDYPAERIDYILEDSQCKVMIDQKELNLFREQQDAYSKENPVITAGPASLAYVIYTSGTTGNPKGTLIQHNNVVRLFTNDAPLFDFDEHDSWTMFHSYCFDFSVWEMYGALLAGGRLIVVPSLTAKDPAAYLNLLKQQGITILNQTPSSFYNLIRQEFETEDAALQVRYIIFGGEALRPGKLAAWKNRYPSTRLINMYGITETTVHVTYKEIGQYEIDNDISNIGKPIPTLSCYILDRNQSLLPVGIPGELYVGGEGVCRGYLNKEELTAQRFISSPFRAGERLYKTGDKVRMLENGEMEYFGRIDDQVKIRGYRIELGEIKSAIQSRQHIAAAEVIARSGAEGEVNLIAYIVSKELLNVADLRYHLSTRIPEYMVPAYFVQLDKLPLTFNGKVDKKRLPDPDGMVMDSGVQYIAPRTETEREMAALFESVLNRQEIGVKDDFFSLGGDSIKLLRLLSAIRKQLNVRLHIADVYKNSTVEAISLHIDQYADEIVRNTSTARENEQAVRTALNELRDRILSSGNTENMEDVFPMSPIEKGMIFESLLNPQSGIYHDQMVNQVSLPDFSFERLQHALTLLVEKHPILRTGFNLGDYETEVQIVYKKITLPLSYEDISTLTGDEQQRLVSDFTASELKHPFNVFVAPLWRITLFNIGKGHFVFAFQVHHAIIDGWSYASLMTELTDLYFKLGEEPSYKPIPLKSSYKDFIIQYEIDKKNHTIIDFWKSELADQVKPDLFADEYRNDTFYVHLNAELEQELDRTAAALNTSVKVITLSAWLYLLKTLNYRQQVTVGLVTSNRPDCEDSDKVLGCYLNTIPLKLDVSPAEQCSAHIQAVDRKITSLKEYERLGLMDIVQLQEKDRVVGNPLFDVIFNYVDFHIYDSLQNNVQRPREEGTPVFSQGRDMTNTYLDLSINRTGGRCRVRVHLARKLKAGFSAHKIGQLYVDILERMVADPARPLHHLNALAQEEMQQMQHAYHPEKKNTTFLDLFNTQVKTNPDHIALVFENTTVTYRELDEKTNRFARYLADVHDVQPRDLVGIMLERNEWLIIAMLGILKAGAAYVPIDPDYPQERIEYIVSDSNCRVLVDEEDLNQFKSTQSDLSAASIGIKSLPEDLIYMIYTSGSTGKPKGVMLAHSNISAFVHWCKEEFAQTKFDIVYAETSVCFDLSVYEIFYTLSAGKKMRILKNAFSIPDYLPYDENVLLNTVPSVFGAVLSHRTDLGSVTAVNFCGEPLTEKHITNLNFEKIEVRNLYGPTEDTVYSTVFRIRDKHNILVGKPITGTAIYFLDESGFALPAGVMGEMYLSGAGVARGYYKKEALTAEKFLSDPFRSGERMYRTGDLGRYLPDGNIEFFGRMDDQVKIRGYRIELGEIEKVLESHHAVGTAKVLAFTNAQGDKELAAYIVANESLTITELRAYLNHILPAYMVPAHFVQLDAFPQTPNGKLDKKKLPPPESLGMNSGVTYIAPRNEKEKQLVAVFEEVLKKQPIGISDNFFTLGGDSIKSIQVISRLKQKGLSLTIQDVLRYPEVGELAAHITVNTRIPEQGVITGIVPLGPVQAWFLEHASNHYNQSVLLESIAPVNEAALRAALSALVLHHDALRMVFKHSSEGWQQQNLGAKQGYHLEVHNTNHPLPYYEQLQAGIDLEQGPLLRVGLFGNRLLLVIHHLVVDGVSWRILLEDLSTLYSQYIQGIPFSLPQKTDSFQYWQQQLQHYNTASEEIYWSEQASISLPAFPLDYPDGTNKVEDTVTSSFRLDEKQTTALQHECYHPYHTEINDILVAGLTLAIKDIFDLHRIAVKMEGHGREDIGTDIDTSRTVGWFTTMYPVVLEPGNVAPTDQLLNIKDQLHQVPNKGIGYGVLRYLQGKNYSLEAPVSFNYLGDFGKEISGNKGEELFRYVPGYHGADFSPLLERDVHLAVSGIIAGGRLQISLSYSKEQYDEATISSLLARYQEHLVHLIAELSTAERVQEVSGNQYYYLADWGPKGSQVQLVSDSISMDPEQFKTAVYRLAERHESLRTVFVRKNDRILAHILPLQDLHLNIQVAPESAGNDEQFDQYTAPLWSVKLHPQPDGSSKVSFAFDHAITDGYSTGILLKELNQLYQNTALEPLPFQYSDFTNWQQNFLQSADGRKHRQYWSERLKAFNPHPNIGTRSDTHGTDIALAIHGDLFQDLKQFAAANGLTLNIILMGALFRLLHELSGQDDLTIATTNSGRDIEHLDVSNIIGCFVNILPVRTLVSAGIQKLKDDYLNDLQYKAYPFREIVEQHPALTPDPDLLNNFFFFNYHNYDRLREKDHLLSPSEIGGYAKVIPRTKKDAGLDIMEYKNCLLLRFVFNVVSFHRAEGTHVGDRYLKNLKEIIYAI
ncbi:non-ribosomal peptide synthase/polyketide synthase [Chitinophaga silvisoli]|uniref:Amino acid adenylation domain-containing protein n=1 Tax=Chitinophaga silvisoli TaxID=2291814 RepID=A0A3E1NZX4_9BACT|nr:non-ribosomal peptide synthase/polyketide synthase [Chitinophaga silvisoli]RFM33506.1 amino acid adenylation domain-containing protein [Chitinophaga silvisoli]